MKVKNFGYWMGLYNFVLIFHFLIFSLSTLALCFFMDFPLESVSSFVSFILKGFGVFTFILLNFLIIEKFKNNLTFKKLTIKNEGDFLFLVNKKGVEVDKVNVSDLVSCKVIINDNDIVLNQFDIENIMREKIGMFKWIIFNTFFYLRIIREVSPIKQGLLIKTKNEEKVWLDFFNTDELFELIKFLKTKNQNLL